MLGAQVVSRQPKDTGRDCVTGLWGRRIVAHCWRPDQQMESGHPGGMGLKEGPRRRNYPLRVRAWAESPENRVNPVQLCLPQRL